MTNLLSKLLSPAALLYFYLILMSVAHGVYAAAQAEPPPLFTAVNYVGHLWIIGWWLLTDSRKHGIAWVYDLGLFLSIAWPFIMPYYLLKTRGAKGLLVILAFVGTYIVASAVGVIAYMLLVTLNQ
ncbi:MAG TPA: hypothetical protein VGC61_09020 [Pyrinomonadaceae bacterium]|jgi:hypothetical protein